jgi:hypothetical protein
VIQIPHFCQTLEDQTGVDSTEDFDYMYVLYTARCRAYPRSRCQWWQAATARPAFPPAPASRYPLPSTLFVPVSRFTSLSLLSVPSLRCPRTTMTLARSEKPAVPSLRRHSTQHYSTPDSRASSRRRSSAVSTPSGVHAPRARITYSGSAYLTSRYDYLNIIIIFLPTCRKPV